MFSVGPPAPFVAPAPREHGTPPQGFGNPTVVIPPSTLITPFEVPVAEGLGTAAARVLAGVLAAPLLVPAALTLALILAASTPAGGPGIPQVVPANPDELRLRALVARHAAGTLTADEETELIALLGKVRGVHIQKLDDLQVEAPLRGGFVQLPGFYKTELRYTKRNKAELTALRAKFAPIREQFLKELAADPAKRAHLMSIGLTNVDLTRMEAGQPPSGWQVHHKKPLDDGGDNSLDNLGLSNTLPPKSTR